MLSLLQTNAELLQIIKTLKPPLQKHSVLYSHPQILAEHSSKSSNTIQGNLIYQICLTTVQV